MISKLKLSIFIGTGFILSLWLLAIRTNSIGSIEHLYSRQEYSQDLSKIYYDLGTLSHKRKDHTKAIDAYTAAIKTKPDFLEAYDALGKVHEETGRMNEALKIYLQAMSEDANFIECRVCNGNLAALKNAPNSDLAKLAKAHEWDGESLTNKTIYLYAEKGLGDSIHFARFLPLLAKKASKVYFKPPKWLLPLFKISFRNSNIEFLESSVNPDDLNFDYYASLLGIARYLDVSVENLPGKTKYLFAPQEKVEKFRTQIFSDATDAVKIGIFWQGEPNHINDKNRSLPLAFFKDLFSIPGVKMYSLQKGFGREQLNQLPQQLKIQDLDQYIVDWTDTAALVENFDVLITADTAVAHLGGALGKPTWILLPHVTDWRWFMHAENEKSCWYSSLTKFRQNTPGDWHGVLETVKQHVVTQTKMSSKSAPSLSA